MFLIINALFLLAALILYVFWQQKRSNNQQLQGLLLVTKLGELINQLQGYRQLKLLQGCGAITTEMKEKLAFLISQPEQLPVVQSHPRWHAFTDHWSRLSQSQSQNTSTDNQLEQYQHLLGNLLQLQQELARHYELKTNLWSQSPPLNLLLQNLPQLIEFHRQLQVRVILYYRQQYNLNYQKLKLQKELTEMRQLSLTLLSQLKHYQQPIQQHQTGQIAQYTAQFITRVSTELLTGNCKLLSEDALWQLSEANIQHLLSLQHQELHRLKLGLKQLKPRLQL